MIEPYEALPATCLPSRLGRYIAEVRQDRLFRDRLRWDDVLRDRYVALKRGVTRTGISDSVDYADAKAAFIRAVLGATQSETR